MKNPLGLKTFSYEDIRHEAEYLGIPIPDNSEASAPIPFCPYWTYRIVASPEGASTLTGTSEFGVFEISGHDLKQLHRDAMILTLETSISKCSEFNCMAFIFLIYHLWRKGRKFKAAFHGAVFGSFVCDIGWTEYAWDNREREWSASSVNIWKPHYHLSADQANLIARSIVDLALD